ncbi:hypothetical protein PRIPAC_74328 [Pristionchus pacificus]|uniref:THAP-type domain-containing protein n=1 Tax=Pristionchus pacificus TaxID=54126 RepID=A0A2A6BRA3_PRIPA|nr:hypothetical protein PRIPAC_74328 [Pristionchus pacificus]|eukprot:PDM68459.1 hypothetical protein PRIPAC_43961 [Pristionchus pacificus]
MERCIFCGWNRRTAFQSIRFFMIPREPGMKQLMWMHAIDKKCATDGQRYEQCPRDRVCSVHFRQGRPSNDMSHEDYTPHLYLTSEPPVETYCGDLRVTKVLNYLENLAETKSVTGERPGGAKHEPVHGEYKAAVNSMNPNRIEVSKVSRPSILQRKRKLPVPEEKPPVEEEPAPPEEEEQAGGEGVEEGVVVDYAAQEDMFAASHPDHRMAQDMQHREEPPGQRRVKLQAISRDVIEAIGARAGQVVIIKRKVLKGSRANSVMGE